MDYNKLDKRIDDMLKYENDNFLVNINLKPDVCDKLLDYQYLHVFNLITALRSYNTVLDGSDTGTGKTYTAVAVCKQMGLKPFIICPKTIITTWQQVCNHFGVRPLAIANYETVKNGKQYDKFKNRIDSNFINVDSDSLVNIYRWRLPRNSIIIFDEVHRCKNKKSQNAALLMSTKFARSKVMLISATLSDTPESFHVFGYMLEFYKNMRQARNWINGMLREDMNYIGSKPKLSAINRNIFPFKGSRMRIEELGDKFPKNQISAECYDISKEDEDRVNKAFDIIDIKNAQLHSCKGLDESNKILGEIMKSRQEIELIKIGIFEELVTEYIENGFSVVIFVNFIATLKSLTKKFNTNCIIRGNQTDSVRDSNIKDFQANRSNLIISTIKAGGQGISLHDIHGNHPRVSLISPSFSSIEFTQVLGRISRAGAKTPALQRIIYCANTCEEVICYRLKDKLKFTAKINDNDLVKIR